MITLSTDNALALPLPHPLLFQIHAVISRVVAMKAAAGFPLFPVFDEDDDADCGAPAFVDTAFLGWLRRHPHPAYHEVLQEHAPDTHEPRVEHWCKLTPTFPVRRLKRTHPDEDDEDEERPRMYTVVLDEACQRMDEKRQLAERRMMEPEEGMYWCG